MNCSQTDELNEVTSAEVATKATAVSNGYYITPTAISLAPYSQTAPRHDSIEIHILDSEGWLARVNWSTNARSLIDATVASGGYGSSFAIYATGDNPSGRLHVLVGGERIGVVTVSTSGILPDTTIMPN